MIRLTSKYTRGEHEFNTIFTVWDLEENSSGKSMNVTLNTSRELDPTYDKKAIDEGLAREYNGKYYARTRIKGILVQEAFNKAKKYNLENGQKITSLVGDLTCELYTVKNKEGEILCDENGKNVTRYGSPMIKILDFELYERDNQSTRVGIDKPPRVEEDTKVAETVDESEYPF